MSFLYVNCDTEGKINTFVCVSDANKRDTIKHWFNETDVKIALNLKGGRSHS